MAGVAVRVLAAEVFSRLQAMEARGKDLTPLFGDFGEYMKGSVQANFDAGGRPQWEPLKFSTKVAWALRRRGYWGKRGMTAMGREAWGGRKPLTDTTRLRRSIAYRAAARSLKIFTNVEYAAIHQFGGAAGRGHAAHIPARPYLVFQPGDLSYFEQRLAQFVAGK